MGGGWNWWGTVDGSLNRPVKLLLPDLASRSLLESRTRRSGLYTHRRCLSSPSFTMRLVPWWAIPSTCICISRYSTYLLFSRKSCLREGSSCRTFKQRVFGVHRNYRHPDLGHPLKKDEKVNAPPPFIWCWEGHRQSLSYSIYCILRSLGRKLTGYHRRLVTVSLTCGLRSDLEIWCDRDGVKYLDHWW